MPIHNVRGMLTNIEDISKIYGLYAHTYGCGMTNHDSYAKIIQIAEVRILRDVDCSNLASNLQKAPMILEENLFCSKGQPFVQIRDVCIIFI
jgi:hypothetical protein